jgi:hypothetical protein
MNIESNKHKEEKVESSVGVFIKQDADTGIVTYTGRTDVTVDELKDFLKDIYDLMKGQPFYLINDLTHHYGSFSNEVWEFLGTDKKFNSTILHSIVISTNLAMKIQLNFFVKLIKPSFKITQVKSHQKAFELVEKLKTKNINKNKNTSTLVF